MQKIAKVRILSPLTQLDREFDYLIPEEIPIKFGNLVKVPFGNSKGKLAVVVDVTEESSFNGELSSIASLESLHSLLTQEQLRLAVQTAERYAGSVSDILKDLLPSVSKAVDKATKDSSGDTATSQSKQDASLEYLELKIGQTRTWAEEFLDRSELELQNGRSTLVVLPDFRELEIFERLLQERSLANRSISHSTSQRNSELYRNYLRSLDEVAINYGLRSASFKPVRNLGTILLLDDGDESHIEVGAPYWNSREILLMRQKISSSNFLVASFSPSAEVIRLIELGYLKHFQQNPTQVIVRCTDNQNRLDDETFGLISTSLSHGKSVLIQTANLGFASSLICVACKKVRSCPECESRIWIDPRGATRCRNCSFIGSINCSCGSAQVRVIRTGSTAMQNWLQKAFPQTEVIHSSASERITLVASGPKVVIATPGAEPNIPGGFAIVVLADAGTMLGTPMLRATERACSAWANAASKVDSNGIVIFVGVTGDLAQSLKQMNFFEIVKQDCNERRDLDLPPYTRIGSLVCNDEANSKQLSVELDSALAGKIKILDSKDPLRISFLYPYKSGLEIAKVLVAVVREHSKRIKSKGTHQKPTKLVMDDWHAI